VVNAVDVPVTVKIRTGTNPENRNAVTIAKIAQDAGVQAITIHGRTRQCRFVGAVEYDTIAAVKQRVTIPIIANGDIDSPETAAAVLQHTGADGVMIGRAAQGRPWLFKQIGDFLVLGRVNDLPSLELRAKHIFQHVEEIHQFYGERLGVRLARKHIKWYLQHWDLEMNSVLRARITATEDCVEQKELFTDFLFSTAFGKAA
jgi:tRNA-dihydrouridine synthase B